MKVALIKWHKFVAFTRAKLFKIIRGSVNFISVDQKTESGTKSQKYLAFGRANLFKIIWSNVF